MVACFGGCRPALLPFVGSLTYQGPSKNCYSKKGLDKNNINVYDLRGLFIVKRRAFTLIELVVVMAIIAVLSLLVVGAIATTRRTAMETVHRSNLRTAMISLEAAYAKNRVYPCLSCYAWLGHPTVLSNLQINKEHLIESRGGPNCIVNPGTANEYNKYGILLLGKLHASWGAFATEAENKGLDMNGKDILLITYNWHCGPNRATQTLEWVALP